MNWDKYFNNPLILFVANAGSTGETVTYQKSFSVTCTATSSNKSQYLYVTGTNITVDWGDGTSQTGEQYGTVHTFSCEGEYTVTVTASSVGVLRYSANGEARNIVSAINSQNFPWHTVSSVDHFMYYAANLTSIPEGLFDGCQNILSAAGSFMHSGLTSVPSTIFADCCLSLMDVSYCFNGCEYIQGDLPVLWDSTVYRYITSYQRAFRYCTGADNYFSVPSSWR